MNYINIKKYAIEVLDGSIVAGEYIKLACSRYLQLFERPDIEFVPSRVDWVTNFISTLKHYTGIHSGKPFQLEDWQYWIICNIYGFQWVETKKRVIRSVYIEIARKNGKSFLAAALCLYHLIADKEPAAEVLLAANSKEQSKIAFEMCAVLARQLDPKGAYLEPFRDNIRLQETNSKLKCLAADDSKLDGFNASMFLIDERHASKTNKLYDVLASSQGMRSEPLAVTITTAGFDKNSPCFKARETGIEVLRCVKEDIAQFCAIYALDDNDDWKSSFNWKKSNPNLGITVTEEFIKQQVKIAENNPSDEVGVKTKTLNIWTDTSMVWIPSETVLKLTKPIAPEEEFKDCDCWVGVDLAATSDLTAVAYMWLRDNKYYFKVNYYLPESALITSPNKDKYKDWNTRQQLIITPGNVTDYDYITRDLVKASELYNIQSIAYDQFNATQWAIDATAKGLPLEVFSQSLVSFNRPTKELERLFLGESIVLDNNEITRYCFKNTTLKFDSNNNCKPIKSGSWKTCKIDGVVAIIQALGIYLQEPRFDSDCVLFTF